MITRRDVLKTGGGFAGTLAAASPFATTPAGASRPNILWLVSEDNQPFIGAYGDPLATTPTLDALAAGGLLFENVYSTAPVCAPSRFGILTGIRPESCGPAQHMRAEAKLPREFRTYPELLRAAGYFCSNNYKTDYNCDVDPAKVWDRVGREAHYRDRADGQPFMAVFNLETTHESRNFQPNPGRRKSEDMVVPAHLPDTPEIRADLASYYNLMERMDGEAAAHLKALAEAGLAEDTIVFYYSDNGGILPRSKRYCYDQGLRCGLIIHVPAKWRHLAPAAPGARLAGPVTLLDLAPTVLTIAGVPVPEQMQGRPLLGAGALPAGGLAFGMRNRMDERYDFVRTVTDGRWRYLRNYMPHRPWGQHQAFAWLAKSYQSMEQRWRDGQLDADQARFFGEKPYEELYDLQADPSQLRNLAQDPGQAGRKRRLSRELDAFMLRVSDNGFIPEGMAGEGYHASRDRVVYPLPDIMLMAERAARRDAKQLPRLLAGLSHDNPIRRYWAASGLLMLREQAAPATAALRHHAAEDAELQVRIVAAEALQWVTTVDESVAALLPFLEPTQDWRLQLAALNALTFMPKPPATLLAQVKPLAESAQEYINNAARYLVAVLEGSYHPAYPVFDRERMMRRFGA